MVAEAKKMRKCSLICVTLVDVNQETADLSIKI